MLRVDCLLMELIDLGVPPSMDSDKVWSDATNSTAWKLPSFTVSTLTERERFSLNVFHPSWECGIIECAVGHLCLYVQVPVYSRWRVRSSVVADPEAPPVQLHGNVIIVSLIQQHSTVLICGNLKTQRDICVKDRQSDVQQCKMTITQLFFWSLGSSRNMLFHTTDNRNQPFICYLSPAYPLQGQCVFYFLFLSMFYCRAH